MMEINVNWESSEILQTNPSIKLKDFLNENSDSLHGQLVEQDFSLKFNNNNLSKLLMTNQIGDLHSKFHGGKILITPTKETLEDLENTTQQISEKEKKLSLLKTQIQETKSENLKNLDFNKLTEKMKSLLKPLDETNIYYTKVSEKIIKHLLNYNIFLKDESFSEEIKTNMAKVKIGENLLLFMRIVNDGMENVMNFIYKYGGLFVLSSQSFSSIVSINPFWKFCEIFMNVYKMFVNSLLEKVKNSPKLEESIKLKETEYVRFFEQLRINIYSTFLANSVDNLVPETTVFFSFEEPRAVNISESEYYEIKGLLSQFPTLQHLKDNYAISKDDDFMWQILGFILERNIRIYQNYGIKMEDFVFAKLLYED